MTSSGNLEARKEKLENRLKEYGITNMPITHLPYLDYKAESFASPYEAGCRMIILYAIAYSTQNLEDRKDIIEWLKGEELWDKVSPREKAFLEEEKPSEDTRLELSWRIEGAYILAWALNLVNDAPSPEDSPTDDQMEEFMHEVPEPGDELREFFNELSFRPLDEIYDENLFYELTTAYFRDLLFHGGTDNTNINRLSAFERHRTLNWLRRFMGFEDWDEVDMST